MMSETKILNESELKEVEAYAARMKREILNSLKAGKVDKLQEAVEDKLREGMMLCAQDFFDKELKADLLKQFASQKAVLVNIGTEAITAIANSLKDSLSKMIAERMQSSYQVKKFVNAMFD